MSEALGQMMPFEFGQVFKIPDIITVESTLLMDHFLSIETQCGHLGYFLITEFDPPLPETDSFASSVFYSFLAAPLAFGEKVNSLYFVMTEKLADVVWSHKGRNSRHIDHTFVTEFFLILFEVSFII